MIRSLNIQISHTIRANKVMNVDDQYQSTTFQLCNYILHFSYKRVIPDVFILYLVASTWTVTLSKEKEINETFLLVLSVRR